LPDWTSAAYSSKVVWELVYSSRISVRAVRSSSRSGSVRWRDLRFWRTVGRRAAVALWRREGLFFEGVRRFRRVESRRRVVFSLGERRRRWV